MKINGLNIAGKCALNEEQLKNISKYFDIYEVQLLDKDMSIPTEELVELCLRDGCKPVSVHTPLTKCYATEVSVELLDNPKAYADIEKSFSLANALAKKTGEYISVVLHTMSKFEMWINYVSITESTMQKLFGLLEKYPHTYVALENMVPYCILPKNSEGRQEIMPLGSIDRDNEKLARYYIESAPEELKSRIKLTIDTCHSKMSEDFRDTLQPKADVATTSEIFEKGGDLCSIVHLATCTGNGLAPGTHGTGFRDTAEDILYLDKCLSNIARYCKDAYIVLEQYEFDYIQDSSRNKRETVKLIKTYNLPTGKNL